MNSMAQAEKDLAVYAAIIGYKPTVEPAPAEMPAMDLPEPLLPALEPAPEPVAHEARRITLWMRHVSHEAKKRIHEARMRLAS